MWWSGWHTLGNGNTRREKEGDFPHTISQGKLDIQHMNRPLCIRAHLHRRMLAREIVESECGHLRKAKCASHRDQRMKWDMMRLSSFSHHHITALCSMLYGLLTTAHMEANYRQTLATVRKMQEVYALCLLTSAHSSKLPLNSCRYTQMQKSMLETHRMTSNNQKKGPPFSQTAQTQYTKTISLSQSNQVGRGASIAG
jgi:hypothetical protein